MRYLFLSFIISFSFSKLLLANEFAPNELLEMLNQDPSLLLDPRNKIDTPPPELPANEASREIQNDKSEVEEKENNETGKKEGLGLKQIKVVEAEADEKKPEDVKVELQKEPEQEAAALNIATENPGPIKLLQDVKPEPLPLAAKETPVLSSTPTVPSQLFALPGVNDFSIILSENEFFPALIKMKESEKARLLFISTSSRPGALIFSKPQIQRWHERQPASSGAETKREISSSKVTQIEFSAERGIYKFYDALSGATGEIQVE